MTSRDAARIAGVSEVTFWRWIKAGRLVPVQRNGRGRKYYLRSQVLALVGVTDGNGPGPDPQPPRRRRGVTDGNSRVAAAHEQLDLVDLAKRGDVSAETVRELFAAFGPAARILVPAGTRKSSLLRDLPVAA